MTSCHARSCLSGREKKKVDDFPSFSYDAAAFGQAQTQNAGHDYFH
jgi:hypothetical protein